VREILVVCQYRAGRAAVYVDFPMPEGVYYGHEFFIVNIVSFLWSGELAGIVGNRMP
jgi:hypothetical protein